MIRRPVRFALPTPARFVVKAILGHATRETTVCTRSTLAAAADALASTLAIASCSFGVILDTDTGREISLVEAQGL